MLPPSRNVPSDQPIFFRVAQRACEITKRIKEIAKAFFISLANFFLSPFRSSPVITTDVATPVVPVIATHVEAPADETEFQDARPTESPVNSEDESDDFEDCLETGVTATDLRPAGTASGVDANTAGREDENENDYSLIFETLFNPENHVATSRQSPPLQEELNQLPIEPAAETEAQKQDRVKKALMMPQVKIDALKKFLKDGASCSFIATLGNEVGKYVTGENCAPFEDIVYFIQQNPDQHSHIQQIEKTITKSWVKKTIVLAINQFKPSLEKLLTGFNSNIASSSAYTVLQSNDDGTQTSVTQYTSSTLKERFELCGITEDTISALYTAFDRGDSKKCFQLLFPRIVFN